MLQQGSTVELEVTWTVWMSTSWRMMLMSDLQEQEEARREARKGEKVERTVW